MNAPDILSAAAQHMLDRAATYDKPEGERSMGATVEAFNAVTGHSLTEEQGWLFMALLKAVRSQQGAFRPDSYEDGAAYFALAGEAAHKERAPASFGPINAIDFRRTEQWPDESRSWDEAEARMDVVAQNGPTGEHYQQQEPEQ